MRSRGNPQHGALRSGRAGLARLGKKRGHSRVLLSGNLMRVRRDASWPEICGRLEPQLSDAKSPQSSPARSHDLMNAPIRAITSGSARSGAWPWSGTTIVSIAVRRAAMAATVASDRRSEFAPRITIRGTWASASNSFQSAGIGVCGIEALQRAGQPDVIGRHQLAAALLPGAMGRGQPVGGTEARKLGVEQAAQDVGAFIEAAGRRQLADIALDAEQTLRLDHRADVVENDAGDRVRPRHRQQHRQKPAARCADDHRRLRAQRRQHRLDVGQFDRERIIAALRSYSDRPRPREVQREGAARCVGIGGEANGKGIEVGRRARQARQREHGEAAGIALAAGAHMQAQAIRRGDEQAFERIGGLWHGSGAGHGLFIDCDRALRQLARPRRRSASIWTRWASLNKVR